MRQNERVKICVSFAVEYKYHFVIQRIGLFCQYLKIREAQVAYQFFLDLFVTVFEQLPGRFGPTTSSLQPTNTGLFLFKNANFVETHLSRAMRKRVLCHMRTTKALIKLRIRAV